MITISERIAKDIPGHTSLFVEFQYNAKYVEIMKTCPVALFHRKEKIWEAPVSSLASLIDQFSPYDDLEINLLQDKKLEHKLFEIGPYKLKPFKHQEEAIQYGLNHNKWLLLDLPGLGKTGVIIHIAEELKKREKIEHCLIVCGVNTLKHNWIAEIKKHSNESARILGQRVKKNGKIRVGSMQDKLDDLKNGVDEFFIVTNIETLREKDIIKELNKQYQKYPMIACDEVHTCLVGDSLIDTDLGLLKIEDIVQHNINCKVKSFDTKLKMCEYKDIISRSKLNSVEPLLEISIEADDKSIKKLKCTASHRIFTHNRGWVQAKDLTESDILEID